MITLLCHLLLSVGVTITLPAEAKVAGTEVSLGAIAKVECDDPALAARISAVRLGYAPAPGYSRVLDAAALLRQVRAGVPDADVRFKGSGTCRVSPATEPIAADALAEAARNALRAHLSSQGFGDCLLELQTRLQDIEVPKGQKPPLLEVAPQPEKAGYSPATVAVRVVVDGQPYRTTYTTWSVKAWRDQPVLLAPVRAGDVLEAGMFELRRTAVDAGSASAVLDSQQVIGAAASHPMEAGKTLLAGDLVRPQIVQKGDLVILAVSSGAVNVRTPATATQAGARGDRVKVVVQSTGREINAVIESRDTVRIDLGDRQAKKANR